MVLYGLARAAFRFSGHRPYCLDPSALDARLAVPLSAFPWALWGAYLTAFVAAPVLWETWRVVCLHEPASDQGSRRAMGFILPRPWPREIGLAVALSAAVLAYVALLAQAAHWRLPRALFLGNAAFCAANWGAYAAAEETLFRGFLQRRLSQVSRPWAAVLLAAAVWAFAGHWRMALQENLYLRMPVGVALGWLYARSGSLLPPILAHWLINLGVSAGL
jgi:membrane protease YdiL (CAAX protease family)